MKQNSLHSRGEFEEAQRYRKVSLPHLDGVNVIQHITYHLSDSVPSQALMNKKTICESIKNEEQRLRRFRTLIDEFMDSGYGSCLLKTPELAQVIIDTWEHFREARYDLLAYVVMPNHCHVLIQTNGQCTLPQIVLSWKSFTARRINEWKTQRGLIEVHDTNRKVWHHDYWDRYIRNLTHYYRVVEYIENNPVKAGLVNRAGDWEWSSAR
ncbi:MAG: transposase [Bacteroidota bacterium]